MRNPKYPLLALVAYLALIGVLAISTARPAHTQGGLPPGKDVRVINTAIEPVPVTLKSPSPVPVTLQGTAQIDTSSPIPVRDVSNPALQPFRASTIDSLDDGTDLGSAGLTTVPAGKRLVIDFVTAAAFLQSGQRASLQITVNGSTWPIAFTQVNLVDKVQMTATQGVQIILEPEETLGIRFTRDGGRSGVANVDVRVSGHYVDIP
jgi:hypothetical protein